MSLALLEQRMFPETIASQVPARKTPGKTVMAHISDLHFTADTEFAKQPWSALDADLAHQSRGGIDILVVTGDIIDAPAQGKVIEKLRKFVPENWVPEWSESETKAAFDNASAYLLGLCEKLSIDPATGLFIVPGNHDYRLLGIHRSRRQPQEFYDCFKDFCRPLLLPTLGLCVFVLDSNVMEFTDLAAGRINNDHLVNFYNLVNRVKSPDLTKVALLHHHPMPIPDTEKVGLQNHPGFTMLKNAGQFMSTMVACKIDLILHGHEHHAAYSKAMFPFDKDNEHYMTVISAGSVGKGVGTYNLITVADDGQIDLERRSHKTGTLYQNQDDKKLRNYEDARRALFETYAMASGAQLRVERIIRRFDIKTGSGDAVLYERYDNVKAYSLPVKEWPLPLRAPGGFFFTPQFHSRSVNWEWDDTDSPDPDERTGRIIFDPLLTKDRPISFDRLHTTFNLFQFNKQDKRDLTQDKNESEEDSVEFRNAIEIFTATLLFPEGNFPKNFYYSVENRKGDEDPLEREYFTKRISTFEQSRTVNYTIERPLPGYKYKVCWELPALEQDEMNLSGIAKARGNDVVARLLAAGDPATDYHEIVHKWMNALRAEVTSAQLWTELEGNDDLEISLYVDDRSQRGLVCVAASPRNGVFNQPWDDIIKPGDTLIGAAYRRRQPVFYNPLSGVVDQDEYRVRIPDSWSAADPNQQYIANCAIPLTYPLGKGRRVAVLTFASRDVGSRLLLLLPDKNDSLEAKREKEARQTPLIEKVTERQFGLLVNSLGVAIMTRVGQT